MPAAAGSAPGWGSGPRALPPRCLAEGSPGLWGVCGVRYGGCVGLLCPLLPPPRGSQRGAKVKLVQRGALRAGAGWEVCEERVVVEEGGSAPLGSRFVFAQVVVHTQPRPNPTLHARGGADA